MREPDRHAGSSAGATSPTPTNERTVIASHCPPGGRWAHRTAAHWADGSGALCSRRSQLVRARLRQRGQKVGGTHITFFIVKQLPMLCPTSSRAVLAGSTRSDGRLARRTRARAHVHRGRPAPGSPPTSGTTGPPFRWDPERRFLLRAELDAAFFHLYGIERDEVDYVIDTFPIVRRKDEAKHGEYRTKRVILEIYDALDDDRRRQSTDRFSTRRRRTLRSPMREPLT